MIAQGHQIGAVIEYFLVDRRRQPGSTGGVLRVDDDAVDLVFIDQGLKRYAQRAATGCPYQIAYAKKHGESQERRAKHDIPLRNDTGGRLGAKGRGSRGAAMNKAGRNKRSVWTVSTKPYKGAHFATFPPALIEPMILAGCPEGGTVFFNLQPLDVTWRSTIACGTSVE